MTTFNLTPTSTTTIQAALTSGGTGTIINLAAGVYRSQQITTPVNTFQIIGDAAGGTIINGASLIEGWTFAQVGESPLQGTWTSNRTFTRIAQQSTNFGTGSTAQFGEEVFFDNMRLVPSTTTPPVSGKWYWNSGRIVIADNPIGHVVEIAQIVDFFIGGNGFSGELMQDVTIEKFATPALATPYGTVVAGPSSTYTRCTFQKNHGVGLVCFSASTTVVDCKFLYNGMEGFAGNGCNSLIMTGCESAYNGQANFNLLNDGGGGKIAATTTGNNFSRNYIHDNNLTGAWWDVSCASVSCRHNLCVRNAQGISYEISTTGTIQYNVCLQNGGAFGISNVGYPTQINLYSSDTTTIDNNYLECGANSGGAFMLLVDATRTGNNTNHNVITNNTVVFHDSSAATGMFNYNSSSATGTGYTTTINNNKYYSASTSDAHFTWWDNTFNTFATWQSSHGFDAAGSITAANWPEMVVITATNLYGNMQGMVNTTNAPCALYGGIRDQVFDPGGYAYPSHIWLNKGTNTLIIRIGCSGMVVHDWTSGGGTNSIIVTGYSFASAAAVISAITTSGSNSVLTLTDGNTVTFCDTTLSNFTAGQVSLTAPSQATSPLTETQLLTTRFQDGQSAGSITPAYMRQLIATVCSQSQNAPNFGTWPTGQIVWNSAPSIRGSAGSQYVQLGWVCSVGGTPGTWVAIQAPTGT